MSRKVDGERRSEARGYQVWIEAEEWKTGNWSPIDANSDVKVTFADGTCWIATFFTYANIATLVANWRTTGECLHGTYLWASDMILIDEINRAQIEKVIAHLLETEEFTRVFTRGDGVSCAGSNVVQP